MINLRSFSLIYGVVFLLVGIGGFIPALVSPPRELATAADGRLLGLFPINALHNAVHIAFGVWGLLAYRRMSGALAYATSVAVIYALLAFMGVIPVFNDLFGVPLYGHDVWLHALLAAGAAVAGLVARSGVDQRMADSGR